MEYCGYYCGVTCVNGNCPRIAREYDDEEYIKKGVKCKNCFYYRGCEDCFFSENKEYPCPKNNDAE